jgi:hypothetical protein
MKLETQLLIEKMKQSQALATAQVERQLAQLDLIQQTELETENLSPMPGQMEPQPAGDYTPGAEEQL